MERYSKIFTEDIEYEIEGQVFISPDIIENGEEYYFVDPDIELFYDEETDEFFYYDEDELEESLEESFTKDKPKPEAGYEIRRTKKRIDGKVVTGYEKRKKKGSRKKKSKLSRSALKRRAKKAARTKKAKGSSYKRKVQRKAKKTRKLNK